MRTVGVDLAAQPANTAVCVIDWDSDSASAEVEVGVPDDRILNLAVGADKMGIDAPFGWPVEFVKAVGSHERMEPWPHREDNTVRLRLRRTDTAVAASTGKHPLSVSTDKLGITTFRCARLLTELSREGFDAARDGSGDVAEVYPAGALTTWGLPATGYKGSKKRPVLNQLGEELLAATPWLEVDEKSHRTILANDDAFDALVCSLVARAVVLGRTAQPSEDDVDLALIEGWIHIPTGSPDSLV